MVQNIHQQNVLKLYKLILRLHKGLPADLHVLGNEYAKEEFRRHKAISSEQTVVFMTEWTNYAMTLAQQLGVRGPKSSTGRIGAELDESDLNFFKDDQIHQLYELMKESKLFKQI